MDTGDESDEPINVSTEVVNHCEQIGTIERVKCEPEATAMDDPFLESDDVLFNSVGETSRNVWRVAESNDASLIEVTSTAHCTTEKSAMVKIKLKRSRNTKNGNSGKQKKSKDVEGGKRNVRNAKKTRNISKRTANRKTERKSVSLKVKKARNTVADEKTAGERSKKAVKRREKKNVKKVKKEKKVKACKVNNGSSNGEDQNIALDHENGNANEKICEDKESKPKQKRSKKIPIDRVPRPTYTCTMCAFSVKGVDKYQAHMLSVHSMAHAFSCEICGKGQKTPSNLKKHMDRHVDPKPVLCEICGKHFSSKYDVRRHAMRTHEKTDPVTCEECGIQARDIYLLRAHMKRMHGESSEAHVCPQCGKAFNQKCDFERHVLIHNPEKHYHCEECNKSFVCRSYLVRHSRVHRNKAYIHQCTICEKVFKQQTNLQQHIATHTEGKTHKCEFCGKKFTLERYLKAHWKVHYRQLPTNPVESAASYQGALYQELSENDNDYSGQETN